HRALDAVTKEYDCIKHVHNNLQTYYLHPTERIVYSAASYCKYYMSPDLQYWLSYSKSQSMDESAHLHYYLLLPQNVWLLPFPKRIELHHPNLFFLPSRQSFWPL